MPYRTSLALALLLSARALSAAELPCVSVERQLRAIVSSSIAVPPAFLECVRSSRVCVLSFPEGNVLRADSIRQLPTEGASYLGIVQTSGTEVPALCLTGVLSGGSSAAWLFAGWTTGEAMPKEIPGMNRGTLNSDAVPPR